MSGSRDPPVMTKLQPISPGHRTIKRVRLEQLLDRVLDHRLTLICAGAGYGKTTLLSALSLRDHPVAWYSLGRSDADPAVFLSYLSQGISSVLGDSIRPPNSQTRARTHKDFEARITNLANSLTSAVD